MPDEDPTAPRSAAFPDDTFDSEVAPLRGDTHYEDVGFTEEVGVETGGAQRPLGAVYEPVTTSYVAPASGSAAGYGAEPTSTTDVAKDQAQQVGSEAVAGGQHVAGVAADQAKTVAAEAGTQAKNLLGEARSQLTDQAATQQNNLAVWIRDLAEELGAMVDRSHSSDAPSGTATHLAGQASTRAHSVASWLEDHEPTDALNEVSRFARQRPGLFLALAAVGGLVAGRLTRGLTSDGGGQEDNKASSPASLTPAAGPYTAPLVTSAPVAGAYTDGSPAAAAPDSYWAADEHLDDPSGVRADDFGLAEEPGVLGGDRRYADETARPYDQDPR